MEQGLENGTFREIDSIGRVYYEGYWVRFYAPPPESLDAKRTLIERLTRRAFHHTEEGINTPGRCLEQARAAYLSETDPARRRVNAAMLAGALFNRATDIFTSIVDLADKQVEIADDNELMRQCGDCLAEAMQLGKQVRHFSGEEGVDELWGEPMKAFTLPIAEFYQSRYIKIAWTMRDIDRITAEMHGLTAAFGFTGFGRAIDEYAEVCKQICETAKDDPDNFRTWPRFVAARERLGDSCDRSSDDIDLAWRMLLDDAYRLLHDGMLLVSYIAGTRVPMPRSLEDYLDKCQALHLRQEVLGRASA
ncbi:MAG TPA: hypothetical protein VIW02_00245 [Gammaproteobacteria bacterium]